MDLDEGYEGVPPSAKPTASWNRKQQDALVIFFPGFTAIVERIRCTHKRGRCKDLFCLNLYFERGLLIIVT